MPLDFVPIDKVAFIQLNTNNKKSIYRQCEPSITKIARLIQISKLLHYHNHGDNPWNHKQNNMVEKEFAIREHLG